MLLPSKPSLACTFATALSVVSWMLVPPSAEASIQTTLVANPSREAVTRAVGSSPLRCVQSIERQLCTWRIPSDTPAHAELASSLAGSGPVHVVCDFPASSPDATEPGAVVARCSVHEPPTPRNRRRRKPGTLSEPLQAALALKNARTLVALSHAFAGGPQDCIQRDESEWVCAWMAGPGEPGHSALGALAATAGTARLVCRLPLEGGDRDADSCRAQEAD